MRVPTKKEVMQAKLDIEREDELRRVRDRERDKIEAPIVAENHRRSQLPSEDPEHICGMMCDGQDGTDSYCARLRWKLFGG